LAIRRHLPHQQRRSAVIKTFGPFHVEPTKSKAAEDYVWKDASAVPGTRFELGVRPFKRNNAKDWAAIYRDAKLGKFDDIPPDVLIRNYGNLKRISVENACPVAIEKVCYVFWGATGTGKSRTAWEEATFDAYPKDPMSKFGTAIGARNTWLLMSSVELLEYRIYSDGWTDIRFLWK